jgi:hypothetical protein
VGGGESFGVLLLTEIWREKAFLGLDQFQCYLYIEVAGFLSDLEGKILTNQSCYRWAYQLVFGQSNLLGG